MDRTALRNGRWRDLSLTLERRELTPFEKFKFFREAWPLDGIQLAALEEHAKGNAHEIVIDYGHLHLLPPPRPPPESFDILSSLRAVPFSLLLRFRSVRLGSRGELAGEGGGSVSL